MSTPKKVPVFEIWPNSEEELYMTDLELSHCSGYTSFANAIKDSYYDPGGIGHWVPTVFFPWPGYNFDYFTSERSARISLDPMVMSWENFQEAVDSIIVTLKDFSDADLVGVTLVKDCSGSGSFSGIVREFVRSRKSFEHIISVVYSSFVGQEPPDKPNRCIAYQSGTSYSDSTGESLYLVWANSEDDSRQGDDVEEEEKSDDSHGAFYRKMVEYFSSDDDNEQAARFKHTDDNETEKHDMELEEEEDEDEDDEDEDFYNFFKKLASIKISV